MSREPCKALTMEGRPCSNTVQEGRVYCHIHKRHRRNRQVARSDQIDKTEKNKKSNSSDNEEEEEDEEEYVVEKLVARREDDDGVIFYKVRWLGYRAKDDTWEPKENLPVKLVSAYDKQVSTKKRKRTSSQKRGRPAKKRR